jgi:hypothetical protein
MHSAVSNQQKQNPRSRPEHLPRRRGDAEKSLTVLNPGPTGTFPFKITQTAEGATQLGIAGIAVIAGSSIQHSAVSNQQSAISKSRI